MNSLCELNYFNLGNQQRPRDDNWKWQCHELVMRRLQDSRWKRPSRSWEANRSTAQARGAYSCLHLSATSVWPCSRSLSCLPESQVQVENERESEKNSERTGWAFQSDSVAMIKHTVLIPGWTDHQKQKKTRRPSQLCTESWCTVRVAFQVNWNNIVVTVVPIWKESGFLVLVCIKITASWVYDTRWRKTEPWNYQRKHHADFPEPAWAACGAGSRISPTPEITQRVKDTQSNRWSDH